MSVNPYPPYVDFLVVLLAVVLVQHIKRDGAPSPAQYLISASWDAHSNTDVDLYGQKDGRAVFFSSRQHGSMFLDRDSRGFLDDRVKTGDKVVYLEHHETIAVRGIEPGVYDFGLHLYAVRDDGGSTAALAQPLSVHVEVLRVNPRVEKVYEGDQVLAQSGDALNFWSMRVTADGSWAREPTPVKPFPLAYLYKSQPAD